MTTRRLVSIFSSCWLTLACCGVVWLNLGVVKLAAQGEVGNKEFLERIQARERTYLSRVCKLTEDQARDADGLGDVLQKEALKKPNRGVGFPLQAIMPQIRIAGGAGDAVSLDRRSVNKFRQSVQQKYATLLTAEQKETYEAELKAREEFKQRANAASLVCILDQKVSLKPEQIEPLRESLMKWEEAADIQFSYYLQNSSENYMPPIPESYYYKLLTADQVDVLAGTQKISVSRGMAGDEDQDLIW